MAGESKAANKADVLFAKRIRLRLDATLREREEALMVEVLSIGGLRPISPPLSPPLQATTKRAVASLFTPGGTHAIKGEGTGINDFEVLADLTVVPEAAR